MTEKGRRLTIERIDKYKGMAKEVKDSNKAFSLITIYSTGVTALSFIGSMKSGGRDVTFLCATGILAAISAFGLIQTIFSIAKLIGIQVNMNALKDMLLAEGIDYDAIKEEEKGKNR